MSNQRQTFLTATFVLTVACLAMFQIMKLDDKINLLDRFHGSRLEELEQSVVKLGESNDTKHHIPVGKDQANPFPSSAVQTDELNRIELKLLNIIEGLRKTLVQFTTSDVKIELRKYWTYYPDTVELLKTMDESDARLVNHIKENLLITPAPWNMPYKFSNDKIKDVSHGQVDHFKKIFKNMSKGFFIECGGADGEWLSNTIPLEKELGWQGALIEAVPANFEKLLGRNRKVWAVPTCLSLKNKPTMVAFDTANLGLGKIKFEKKQEETFARTKANSLLNVFCMPIAAIMLALDKKSIDIFSLDIEGDEFAVLQTIPWDKFDIKVLMVEHVHTGQKEAMKTYMLGKGYKTYGEELNVQWSNENYMFVKISSNLI